MIGNDTEYDCDGVSKTDEDGDDHKDDDGNHHCCNTIIPSSS